MNESGKKKMKASDKSEILVKIEKIMAKYYPTDSRLEECAQEIWQGTTSMKTLQAVMQGLQIETDKTISLEKKVEKLEKEKRKIPSAKEIIEAARAVGRDSLGILQDPELIEVFEELIKKSKPNEENRAYLQNLVNDGWISEETRSRAQNLLKVLPIVLQIAPGPDGLVGFNWSFKKEYFSLELLANGDLELFCENLENPEEQNRCWSLDVPFNSNNYLQVLEDFSQRITQAWKREQK